MSAVEESDNEEKAKLKSVLSELEARQNDLAVAAELGRNLLADNEQLRKENSEALEAFRQKIYDLENERQLLKQRLYNVESDYDMQIKELQTDIMSLRVDLKKQKSFNKQLEDERNAVISELTKKNTSLSDQLMEKNSNEARLKKEIDSLRSQFNQRKTSIQDHFHVLDSLSQEISHLREEKNRLESELASVTEERDQLLGSLSDSYRTIGIMERIQQEQLATISNQDSEIANLQERANILHEHLQNLSMQHNDNDDCSCTHCKSGPTQPHRSLLAELAEQRMELLGYEDGDSTNLFSSLDKDDGVEMDDDALLAYVASLDDGDYADALLPSQPSTSAHIPQPQLEAKDSLISELRSEVAEIYQQMRQMCVELHALSNAQSMATQNLLPDGGTHTPDELAMVEMDFRLSSLRSVLGDLRGLLRELVTDSGPNGDKYLTRNGNSSQKIANGTGNGCKSNEQKLNGKQTSPVNGNHDTGDGKHESYSTEFVDTTNGPSSSAGYDPQRHEAMLYERNILAAQVASAQQQLSNLQRQFQVDAMKSNTGKSLSDRLKETADLEDFEDEECEFELPP
ncbi:unnamed protein product [Calicophoron daubneyi]|uniref:Uncharacterized protein n=1 Tax=Calicophoron daubneyi TaxID=300641 RepID=A0AAV2TAZ7_CALDB